MEVENKRVVIGMETRLKNLQLDVNCMKRDLFDNSEKLKALESRLNTIDAERNTNIKFIDMHPELENIAPSIPLELKKKITPGHEISVR